MLKDIAFLMLGIVPVGLPSGVMKCPLNLFD